MNEIDERRRQVSEQCRAVAHMARAIAEVHSNLASLYADSPNMSTTEQVGRRTARLMETLGDVLNGMDAVTEEDEWIDPILSQARQLWPTTPES